MYVRTYVYVRMHQPLRPPEAHPFVTYNVPTVEQLAEWLDVWGVEIRSHVCMYVYMYAWFERKINRYNYIIVVPISFVSKNVCIFVCMYVCTYVYMYVCKYTCITSMYVKYMYNSLLPTAVHVSIWLAIYLGWFTKKDPHKSPKYSGFPIHFIKAFGTCGGLFLGDQPKWKISRYGTFETLILKQA